MKRTLFKKLIVLTVLSAFTGQFASASLTDQQKVFADSINFLNSDSDIQRVSSHLNRIADQIGKRGDTEKAQKMRQAFRPETLAMTRTYLRAELEKTDVNGLMLIAFMAGDDGFCQPDWRGWEQGAVAYCVSQILLAILTLGETNAGAEKSL